MDGIGNGLAHIFNFLIVCFFVAIAGIIYAGYTAWDAVWGDVEIVSPVAIKPELRLTIKNNKVDTLFVYKLKK